MIDTICALSTPRGRAALAIIRISGPKAFEVGRLLTGKASITDRRPKLCLLSNAQGESIDEALVTYFKGPNSYTGEDLIEISCHGNPVIVDALMREIVSHETRIAEAGEFTRRALANNRMSIEEVEALNWILNSTTSQGARMGLKAKLSSLGASVAEVTEEISEILTALQASLDFSELEVGEFDSQATETRIRYLAKKLSDWAKRYQNNKYLLSERSIVLAGPPNSGKSSLFNALVGHPKAIVFDEPGTTRDLVEHSFDLEGYRLRLIDSAGLRPDPGSIEAIGIKKTLEAMEEADLICWVSDGFEPPDDDLLHRFGGRRNFIYAGSKSDLKTDAVSQGPDYWISALNGHGIKELLSSFVPQKVEDFESGNLQDLMSERQFERVMESAGSLEAAADTLAKGEYLDMVTEQVLVAKKAIENLTGEIPNNQILARIFSRFCIGK